MVSITSFRNIALSFPGTLEQPHFDRAAFKVTGRRIFATMHEKSMTANIVLTIAEQKTFCSFDKKLIYPVPNKFGLQGWTTFEIMQLPEDLVQEALHSAYLNVIESKPSNPKKK